MRLSMQTLCKSAPLKQKMMKIVHPRSHKHSPHQGFSKHSLQLVAVLAVLVARRLRLMHRHRHPGPQSFDGFLAAEMMDIINHRLCFDVGRFQMDIGRSEYIFAFRNLDDKPIITSSSYNLQSNVQISKNFLKLSASSSCLMSVHQGICCTGIEWPQFLILSQLFQSTTGCTTCRKVATTSTLQESYRQIGRAYRTQVVHTPPCWVDWEFNDPMILIGKFLLSKTGFSDPFGNRNYTIDDFVDAAWRFPTNLGSQIRWRKPGNSEYPNEERKFLETRNASRCFFQKRERRH